MPDNYAEHAEAKARQRLVDAIEQCRERLPVGELATLLADAADVSLCVALGNDAATHWWRAYVADTTGRWRR